MSLLFINQAPAAKFKLYHCQTTTGSVVVQDRPCAVTRMKSVKPGSQSKKRNKAVTGSKQKYTPKSLAQASLSSSQNRSPQAFIDIVNKRKWPSELNRNGHGWQLTVQVPGKNNSEQAGQLSVQYFRNPQATLNQDAFSYALDLYHEIRHQYRLIDSRFKSHPAYKIFNIAYHKAQLSANTEFYMGKFDGSLWVFSLQSQSNEFTKTHHLMAQLQALM
jgi:hypothetical protein